jgi:hypothetical protein
MADTKNPSSDARLSTRESTNFFHVARENEGQISGVDLGHRGNRNKTYSVDCRLAIGGKGDLLILDLPRCHIGSRVPPLVQHVTQKTGKER